MDVVWAFLFGALAGGVTVFFVYRNNVKWIANVEADVVKKAKDAVNKL